jgi:hypothetical protein
MAAADGWQQGGPRQLLWGAQQREIDIKGILRKLSMYMFQQRLYMHVKDFDSMKDFGKQGAPTTMPCMLNVVYKYRS